MRSEPVDVFLAVEGFVVERCGTAVAAQQGELAVVPDDADFGPRREDIDRAARCGIFEACRFAQNGSAAILRWDGSVLRRPSRAPPACGASAASLPARRVAWSS